MINVLDPDVIVLGGGLSNIGALYADAAARLPRHVFSDRCDDAGRPQPARRLVGRARRRVALARVSRGRLNGTRFDRR